MNILNVLIHQIGVKDVVDIFVVSVLIYHVLLIFHGTRAVQVLSGIGFLVLLFWVGLSFKLYSLNWVLSHFFDSFFIIAIVLFQDQVRSALASVGTGQKVWGFFNRSKMEHDFEEVVEACGALSREKVGAIIVFERNHGLNNYVETGTKVNSETHSDLIYAIFQSSSPLHDGAIIIQNYKIAAAGCFLPLSKNVEIDRHLGSRHRAALGISEVTDAVVVTISEESGQINMCMAGQFYPCQNEQELGHFLKLVWTNQKIEEFTRLQA